MTDTDRDAQTIREALESAFGDWEAGLAALERLVAALSAATTERDEARREANRKTNGALEWFHRSEGLAAQLQQAREALQGLLDAAEAEVGPKLGEPDKNAEYWAALDPDKHVPGVARRVALAHAVIVVRAALAAAAPATTETKDVAGANESASAPALDEVTPDEVDRSVRDSQAFTSAAAPATTLNEPEGEA